MTSLSRAASGVADGVGMLCRLTLGPEDQLRGPADVTDVIRSLSLAMSLMPQLLGQLAAFLEVEHVKGAVAPGTDAGKQVRAVSDALNRAGVDAETMAAALNTARQACAQLGRERPEEAETPWPGQP